MKPLPYRLVVFFGLSGSGKSYLAASWSKKHGFTRYNTDVERKKLAGIRPEQGSGAGAGQGIYTAEFSDKTYKVLLEKAWHDLENDNASCVVLDGTYRRRTEREAVRCRFADQGVLFVYCLCGEEVVKHRLAARKTVSGNVSDADWAIYLQQKEQFDLPGEIPTSHLLCLDTDNLVEYLVECVDRKVFDRQMPTTPF